MEQEIDTRTRAHQGHTPIPGPMVNNPLADRARAKTSLRMRYEAEAKVIRDRLGGLDGVRQTLGLSRKKMAELLLVDPSAWTRWSHAPETTPPWVWRSLSWYLELEGKDPHWQQWREWALKRGGSLKVEPQTPSLETLRSELEASLHRRLRRFYWLTGAQTLLIASLLVLVWALGR